MAPTPSHKLFIKHPWLGEGLRAPFPMSLCFRQRRGSGQNRVWSGGDVDGGCGVRAFGAGVFCLCLPPRSLGKRSLLRWRCGGRPLTPATWWTGGDILVVVALGQMTDRRLLVLHGVPGMCGAWVLAGQTHCEPCGGRSPHGFSLGLCVSGAGVMGALCPAAPRRHGSGSGPHVSELLQVKPV